MPPPGTRRRRWWLIPAVLAALVGLYALAGFYGVPKLARSVAVDQAAKLGRQLEIGEIAFNPFTFRATISKLALKEADGAPIAAFDTLFVDADAWHSLVQRGAILEAVRLDGADVAVEVNADGSLNLAKLAPPSSSTSPAPPKPSGPPPTVVVGDLAISRARVGIEDRSRPQPFALALAPIEFRVKDFRTDAGHANGYTFSAVASTGEEIGWNGDFTVQPLGSKGSFSLRKLQASTITSYLQDRMPVQLVSGSGELEGSYVLTLDPALSLDVKLPSIVVRDVTLADPANGKGARPVAVGEIGIRDTAVSLAKRTVAIGRVDVKNPRADVLREADGSLNLTRLYVAPPPPTAVPPPPSEPSPPWNVTVQRVAIGGGTVNVEDRSLRPALKLGVTGITATATGASSDLSKPLTIDVALGVGKAGRVASRGDVHLSPVSAKLAVELQDLDLTVLQPFLATRTSLNLKSAFLGVKGEFALALPAEGEPAIDFTGDASVSKLAVADSAAVETDPPRARAGAAGDGKSLLRWGELRVGGIAFHNTPRTLDIARVDLVEPFARVEISKEREINLSRALKPPGAPVSAEPVPPAGETPGQATQSMQSRAVHAGATEAKPGETPEMPVRIAAVHIEKGRLRFADRSIEPNFSAVIFDLGGDITSLASDPASRAKVHLEGKVDEFSPVLISGELAPAAFAQYTDIAMSFRNMDLIRFNPYSGRFAGYNIVKGKLTTDLHYRIENRQLAAEHHVVVDQLEFGDATGSKDAVPLPVKLAVALLKDRHGVIDLGLPVTGSLDDPGFEVGPLVWKVLVNALAKAVTSPFSALASLFGGSGEELAYVEFAPGVSTLSSVEAGKLAKLAAALVERPEVKLDVPYAIAEAEDGAALARAELDRRVPPAAAATDTDPGKAASQRLDALRKVYEEVAGLPPDFPKMDDTPKEQRDAARIAWLERELVGKLAPPQRTLERLAADRARSVQSAILANTGVRPERLFLTSEHSAKLTESGTVRMELKLE